MENFEAVPYCSFCNISTLAKLPTCQVAVPKSPYNIHFDLRFGYVTPMTYILDLKCTVHYTLQRVYAYIKNYALRVTEDWSAPSYYSPPYFGCSNSSCPDTAVRGSTVIAGLSP
jgi:hypothetical protein